MTRKLYALLVGIDKYNVSPLSGCVNDIKAVEQYLNDRLDREKYQLEIEKLLDEEAKRQAIIDKFEKHLCKARQDDIVLFYYCGHGSREQAGEEFDRWQQHKKQLETIVCYDSRQTLEDGTEIRDLADKEMRYLISEVATNKPHILVIYDCCHSGSGTRGKPKEGVRSYPIDIRPPRKYEDFLFAKKVKQNTLKPENFPQGKHIFMSACLDSQTAKEMTVDKAKRGVFSYFLLKELENLNATLPYRELLRQVNFRVNGKKKSQTPQFEPIGYQEEELYKLAFLSDAEAIKSHQPYFVLTHRPSDQYENQQAEWMINAGASQLQKGSKLALFKEYSTLEAMQDSANRLGEIEVTEVRLSESVVKFTLQPSNNDTAFYAVITQRVLPDTAFYLESDDDILAQVEKQLETSLYARVERDSNQEHDYRLYARKQRFEITDTEDRLLVQPIEGYSNLSEAVRQIDHIARWTKIKDMENPRNTLSDNVIEVEIAYNGKAIANSDLRLHYQYIDGQWQPPIINLTLKNTHHKPLYCAFLEICDDYSINIPRILPEGGDDYSWICLEPGQEYQAKVLDYETSNPEDIEFFIPEGEGYEDITEYRNYYKLIVSTSQFEVSQYEQSSLLSPENKRQTRRSISYEDWMSRTLPFIIVKPQDAIELNAKKKLLSSGVTIKAPDGLKAKARLVSTSSTIRSLSNSALPPLLSNTTKFQFATSRSIDEELSGLEMEVDLSTIDTVSPNSPIIIEVDKALNPDELLLVVAKDGGRW